MTNPELTWMKEALGLDEHSRLLFFSTEGNTDRENYKAIVWEGKYPSHSNNFSNNRYKTN